MPAPTKPPVRKPPTRSTPPPPRKTPVNPTMSRLATEGLQAPPAPVAQEEGSPETTDLVNARVLTLDDNAAIGSFLIGGDAVIPGATDEDDDLDITMIAQAETERAKRRHEAEARNAATLSGALAADDAGHDPALDFEAPLSMPNLANLVMFECPGNAYLEIQVGDQHYIRFRNSRYRTNNPTELDALRSKKLRQRHGIFEATSDGITEELFWSAKGTFWHSDAARLEYDRINLPGRKDGNFRNPWPA